MRAQRLRGQLRQRESVAGQLNAEVLHRGADASAGIPQIAIPVGVRPDLDPVGDDGRSAQRPDSRARDHRKVGKAARLYDVVFASMPEQVLKDSETETKRRQDAPAARSGIQIPPAIERDQLYSSRSLGRLVVIPLHPREVGNLMSSREALGDITIKPFEAADGVRVETVVNEKYAQRR